MQGAYLHVYLRATRHSLKIPKARRVRQADLPTPHPHPHPSTPIVDIHFGTVDLFSPKCFRIILKITGWRHGNLFRI